MVTSSGVLSATIYVRGTYNKPGQSPDIARFTCPEDRPTTASAVTVGSVVVPVV
jgi:hypothetical protein